MLARKLTAGVVVATMTLAACGGASGGPVASLSDTPVLAPAASTAGPLPLVADVVPTLAFLGDLGVIESPPATVIVGPDGGSMALEDGSTIEVPPASFLKPTELTVVVVDVLFGKYLEDPPEATIYVLSTSEAATLDTPVVLSVPVPAEEVVVEALVDREWRQVDVPPGPTTRIEFNHFSEQIRSIIPRSDFSYMSPTDRDAYEQYKRAQEQRDALEREDQQRAEENVRKDWCIALIAILIDADEFVQEMSLSIANLYTWAVCDKWPVADEDCLTQRVDDSINVIDEIDRCLEPPPSEKTQPDDPASEPADDVGSDIDADDSTSAAPPVPEPPEPPDPEFVSQTTMSESARLFKGEAEISYIVKTTEYEGNGCTVDLSVETEFALNSDGTVTLFFAQWPWPRCDQERGPNPRIYSTPWIGVGDTVYWSAIEIGLINSIRVDVIGAPPNAQAKGNTRFSVDLEVLTGDGSGGWVVGDVIEDFEVYTIDFTLEEA